MRALRHRCPNARFVGIGGPAMLDAGLIPLYPMSRLTMHGFVEPMLRLPELVRLFRSLRRRVLAESVDAFIGIDFNVFNLLLERSLRRRGVATVHYVSPSVYAWRRGRVKRVARAADLLLALFPFEPPLYATTGMRVTWVGHRLADELQPCADPGAERRALQVDGAPLVALLPGSRRSEMRAMGTLFFAAAARFATRHPAAHFVVACTDEAMRTLALRQAQPVFASGALAPSQLSLVVGQSRRCMAAADVVLVKSGTATLEALLLERPMVVAYRLGALTAIIVRALLRTPFVALPNILAGRELVPELLQERATAAALAEALTAQLTAGPVARDELHALAASLRRGADQRAADAVLALVAER